MIASLNPHQFFHGSPAGIESEVEPTPQHPNQGFDAPQAFATSDVAEAAAFGAAKASRSGQGRLFTSVYGVGLPRSASVDSRGEWANSPDPLPVTHHEGFAPAGDLDAVRDWNTWGNRRREGSDRGNPDWWRL